MGKHHVNFVEVACSPRAVGSPSDVPPCLTCSDDDDAASETGGGATSSYAASYCGVAVPKSPGAMDSSALSVGLIPYQPPARVARTRRNPLGYIELMTQHMEELNALHIVGSVEELIRCLTSFSSQAQQLALRGKPISLQQVLLLADAISQNTQVRRLLLESCGLEQPDIEIIVFALEKNTSLTAVSLSGNSCKNLRPLAELLDKNDTLTSLNLSCNRNVGIVQGMEELITSLELNSVLKVLDLTGCADKLALERVRLILKRNKSPNYVVTLHTSLNCSSQSSMLELSFIDMVGEEVACMPDTDPQMEVRSLRKTLAQIIGVSADKLAITLPGGKLLTKNEEHEPLRTILFDLGEDYN